MGTQGRQRALSCFETDAKIRSFLVGGGRLRRIVEDYGRFVTHWAGFWVDMVLQIMC